MKETLVATYRSTATKAKGMGRTFGLIGALYSSTECAIETVLRCATELIHSSRSIALNRTCGTVCTRDAPRALCCPCQVAPRRPPRALVALSPFREHRAAAVLPLT